MVRNYMYVMKKSKLITIVIITVIITAVVTTGIVNPFGFFEFGKLLKFNAAVKIIENAFYENIDKDKETEMAIAGVAASTGDPYTRYLWGDDAKQYMESVEGNYCGVGLYIENDTKENLISVVAPIAGSPADKQGIVSGDKILKIDGEDYTGEQLDEAASYMRGEEGTEVELTIRQISDGKERTVKLMRSRIEIDTVSGKMLDGNIAYIKLTQFTDGAAEKFNAKLKELNDNHPESLIIDLRNNPGGILPEAIAIAGSFVNTDEIVTYTLNKDGDRKDYRAEHSDDSAFIKDIPIIILTNSGSASASEVLSGALRDLGIAKTLGEKTFGKGIVQTVMGIGTSGILTVTTDRYYTPKGVCIHGVGIEPDYSVEMSDEKTARLTTLDASEDDQLKEAIKILKENK